MGEVEGVEKREIRCCHLSGVKYSSARCELMPARDRSPYLPDAPNHFFSPTTHRRRTTSARYRCPNPSRYAKAQASPHRQRRRQRRPQPARQQAAAAGRLLHTHNSHISSLICTRKDITDSAPMPIRFPTMRSTIQRPQLTWTGVLTTPHSPIQGKPPSSRMWVVVSEVS